MAGCALVAESVLEREDGRPALGFSTLVAALFLLLLVVVLGDLLALVPMAALVGIMLMVCVAIFDWRSVLSSVKYPQWNGCNARNGWFRSSDTHDLAIGVIVGVLQQASSGLLVNRLSRLDIHSELDGNAHIPALS